MSNTRRFMLNGASALLVWLAGCGGGGGGNPGPGGTFTEAQRAAIADALSAKILDLAAHAPNTLLDRTATANELIAFAHTRPDIVDSGIASDLSVWVQFPDGMRYVILNNEDKVDRAAKPLPPPRGSTSRAERELPSGKMARLFHMFGLGETFTVDPRDGINSILDKAGYDVYNQLALPKPGEFGSLADFRTVRDPVNGDALFYIGAHGGCVPYTLWTNEVAKEPGAKAFRFPDDATVDDAFHDANGHLVDSTHPARIVAVNATVLNLRLKPSFPPTSADEETHWALTGEFVKKYMRFSQGSFMYVGACFSGGADARDFINACFSKGLSTYGGWDDEYNQSLGGSSAALYLFDRIAGTNLSYSSLFGVSLTPENPPQRPFGWDRVLLDGMNANGLSTIAIPGHTAHFQLFVNPNEAQANHDGRLAPSIEHLEATSTGSNQTELRVFGSFGTKPGTVSVGGKDLELVSGGWTANEIRCVLPAHDAAGGHGDVVVTVDGHRSNPVQLTMWEITFTDTLKRDWSGRYVFQQPQPPLNITYYSEPTGSLTLTTEYKAWVRGDAHLFRGLPAQKPPFNNPARGFVISVHGDNTRDAKITSLSVSGSAQEKITNDKNSNVTTYFNAFTLEGASTIALDGSDNRAQIVNIYGTIDPTNRKLGLVYVVNFDPVVHIDESSDPPNSGGIGMAPTGGGVSFPGSYAGASFQFDLDDSGNVVGGTRQASNPGLGFIDSYTVTWSSSVFDAPNPESARSAPLRKTGR